MKLTIGIGGVSRAGKSLLAQRLKSEFEAKGPSVAVLSQDEFVKAIALIPRIRDRVDWEHPDSIDLPGIMGKIHEVSPQYDIVIIEGLFAFHFPDLVALYDKKIYVEIGKPLFLARKMADDRWGHEPSWFIEHIWESFEQYGKVDSNEKGFLRVSGAKEINLEEVWSFLGI